MTLNNKVGGNLANWDAKVGQVRWEGCAKCKHGDSIKGGCKVDVSDHNLFVEDGYVYCELHESQTVPALKGRDGSGA